MNVESLPVVVIGSGPVGLAAAAHLVERGLSFAVLEAGEAVGASVRDWGHVRLFSPWQYNLDPAAERLLLADGWLRPPGDELPTGRELVERYIEPLAALPSIAPNVRFRARVVGVARRGFDKMKTAGRAQAPFVVRVRSTDGCEEQLLAQAVVDASGTWTVPNPLGADGLPAIGEADAADWIAYGIPDVLGAARARYAGRRVLVVGSGHSAMNALLELIELKRRAPGTSIGWAVRRAEPGQMFGGGVDDALPARGSIGTRTQAAVADGLITLAAGFATAAVRRTIDGLVLSDGAREIGPFDEVIAATGFRPELTTLRELRLSLDETVESPRRLAPLIDPNVHSCGSVPPHGYEELKHPESGFYLVGMKSYGRAPTFLMRTGYEQVRSIVAAIAGDMEAARDVRLVLPETGVCSSEPGGASCCGVVPATDPARIGIAARGELLPLLGLGGSTALLARPLVGARTSACCGDDCCGGAPTAATGRACCGDECCGT